MLQLRRPLVRPPLLLLPTSASTMRPLFSPCLSLLHTRSALRDEWRLPHTPPAPPLHPSGGASSRKFMSFHRKKTPSSSSPAVFVGGGGLKQSKSVAPRPELEQFPYSSSASLAAESPRKKSFGSFLSLTSSAAAYAHQAATPYATSAGAAASRRKSESMALAAWASRGVGGAQDQQPRGGLSSSTLRRILNPKP